MLTRVNGIKRDGTLYMGIFDPVDLDKKPGIGNFFTDSRIKREEKKRDIFAIEFERKRKKKLKEKNKKTGGQCFGSGLCEPPSDGSANYDPKKAYDNLMNSAYQQALVAGYGADAMSVNSSTTSKEPPKLNRGQKRPSKDLAKQAEEAKSRIDSLQLRSNGSSRGGGGMNSSQNYGLRNSRFSANSTGNSNIRKFLK